jgi:hypothetical protein
MQRPAGGINTRPRRVLSYPIHGNKEIIMSVKRVRLVQTLKGLGSLRQPDDGAGDV